MLVKLFDDFSNLRISHSNCFALENCSTTSVEEDHLKA